MAITPGTNYVVARGQLEILREQGHEMRIEVDPVGLTVTCSLTCSDGRTWQQVFSGDDLPQKIRRLHAFKDHPLSVLITFAVNAGYDWYGEDTLLIEQKKRIERRDQKQAERNAQYASEYRKWR